MSTVNVTELYCKDTQVWIPDRERVWVGGEVVRVVKDECVEVQCEGEEGTRVLETRSSDSLPLLRNPLMLVGANDLTTLSYLHEPAVLHNLSVRFLHSKMIYTYCGIVLVALNPYQSLPVYGNETAAAYRGRDMGEMDPHVFAVAEEAFRRMTRDSTNQSIIISGESGAGKTVSAKFVMRYFATVGGASTETQIEKKVLASNPIMEAIGNAKTTRNDNSSRFGKYIEIRFDQENRITGAHMRTYLLERSRVVTQATCERNYHIFYQLCSARNQPDMEDYHLASPELFHYTSQGDSVAIDSIDDQSEFSVTKEAMKLLGFHDNQLRGTFYVLSSILHLGNIEVGRKNKGGEMMSVISDNDKHLLTSASLLGIDSAHLAHWLSHRKITTSREVYHKPLTHAQSITARDSLAKNLYSTLFNWIVNIINSSLSPSSTTDVHTSFIGVLDIYGFEVFEENNFEQFCINYANEKLQQQFIMHVFQLEQAEYMREEIEWSFIDYYDNQPCIDLIENRLGILDLLDETCKMPGGCDSQFIQKLYDNHNIPSSTHFTKPRMSRSAFQIKHYAGPVQYQSSGFTEKNAEQVALEYLKLLNGSTVPFMSTLYKPSSSAAAATVKSKNNNHRKNGMNVVSKATVGSQFRSSLHGLMITLNSTTPHYIRCIKSNDRKLPFVFEPQRAVQQLRACGVLETVRLSAAGYPSRWTYNEFFQRYRLLLSSGQVRRDDVKQMCEYIIRITIHDSSQYRFGKTKLFFRAGQVAYLERLRSQRLNEASVCVQRHVKGWLVRRWYSQFRVATVYVQAHSRGVLARRLALCLKRTKAAVCIQRHSRGLIIRLYYHRLRRAVIITQAIFRGHQARQLCCHLLHDQKAITIQRYVRGWLTRVQYARVVRKIILAQCCVRRWMARRERRRLKLETRSVSHLQNLNNGLEMKIIELQLKLIEGEREREMAQEQWNIMKHNYEKALLSASEQIDTLNKELELTRQTADNAAEIEVASPHTVPDNGWLEQNQVVSPRSIPCMEPSLVFNSLQQTQPKDENVECELERLRNALHESRADCSRLEKQVADLQRDFDNEEPTPTLTPATNTANPPNVLATAPITVPVPATATNVATSPATANAPNLAPATTPNAPNVVTAKTRTRSPAAVPDVATSPVTASTFVPATATAIPTAQHSPAPEKAPSFSLTPSSPHHQQQQQQLSALLGDISSFTLLPPLPHTHTTVRPYSSTPDIQYDSIGIKPITTTNIIHEHDCSVGNLGQPDLKSQQTDEKLGQSGSITGPTSFEMGQISYETGQDTTTDDKVEFLQELVDQLERERQNLLLGNREICQELNKVDASNTATVSTLKKIARENSFLRKQLGDAHERENDSLRERKKHHGEMQGLVKKVAVLKQALQHVSHASSLNASLQQEVTRLTEENLSLLETVEDMKKMETTGGSFRTPMSPRRRTTPCGADSPRRRGNGNSSVKRQVMFSGVNDTQSVTWTTSQQTKIIRELILELDPDQVSEAVPCLPAHMIHLALSYCSHVTGRYGKTIAFMEQVTSAIQQVVQASSTKFNTLTLWLANITQLYNLLHNNQTSFKPVLRTSIPPAGIVTSDLSTYTDKLEDVGQVTYRDLNQLIHNKIQPLIVPGILECDSIPNISSVRPILGCYVGSHHQKITVATVTRELSVILEVLRKHGLPPEIIGALMKQTFFTINAFLLNNLLLRRDMCHWSKGIQIRYNLSQLEDWVRGHGLPTTGDILTQLLPSVEAAKLLQMKKSTAKDADAICELCTHLNPLQVQKLLTMYSPANEYEERVPATIIRLVGSKNGADSADPAQLMTSIDHVFPFSLPLSPSTNTNHHTVSLPPKLRHLNYLMTTVF